MDRKMNGWSLVYPLPKVPIEKLRGQTLEIQKQESIRPLRSWIHHFGTSLLSVLISFPRQILDNAASNP